MRLPWDDNPQFFKRILGEVQNGGREYFGLQPVAADRNDDGTMKNVSNWTEAGLKESLLKSPSWKLTLDPVKTPRK
jgi:hypothetical protein